MGHDENFSHLETSLLSQNPTIKNNLRRESDNSFSVSTKHNTKKEAVEDDVYFQRKIALKAQCDNIHAPKQLEYRGYW